MLSNLRLITLDLQGTVYRFKQSPVTTYIEIGGLCGLEMPSESDVKVGFRKALIDLTSREPHYGSTTHGDSKRWWISVVRQTFKSKFKICATSPFSGFPIFPIMK